MRRYQRSQIFGRQPNRDDIFFYSGVNATKIEKNFVLITSLHKHVSQSPV